MWRWGGSKIVYEKENKRHGLTLDLIVLLYIHCSTIARSNHPKPVFISQCSQGVGEKNGMTEKIQTSSSSETENYNKNNYDFKRAIHDSFRQLFKSTAFYYYVQIANFSKFHIKQQP